ncbi:WhiB family transcriptional regulator [Streptomyces sp. NPDC096030]|uniref:WhiB family transcriptional regulator n=1 Tax=Streptomyces sp. NPDC096030 TaxID=3155423 RepID=UPI0033308F0A
MNAREKHRGPRIHNYTFLPGFPTGNWHQFAACAGADGELFFSEDKDAHRGAQRLCDTCPVVRQCREHAEETPERFGMWGGMTARERGWDTAGIRRARRKAA